MATVKLTESLKSEIHNKIERAYAGRSEVLEKEIDGMFTFDELYNAYIAATGGAELLESCKHWLNPTGRINTETINGVRWSKYLNRTSEAQTVPRWPQDAAIPALSQKTDRLTVLYEQKQALRDELWKTKSNVIDTIKQYGSVNSAVKAHPDLVHLLSPYTQAKLVEVREKREKVEIAPMDLSNIASVAVLARLAEAR